MCGLKDYLFGVLWERHSAQLRQTALQVASLQNRRRITDSWASLNAFVGIAAQRGPGGRFGQSTRPGTASTLAAPEERGLCP